VRTVQDEGGHNQGWTGGLSTTVRQERRCELLITAMTPLTSRKVLEIGCGRGEIARYLGAKTGMQVLGIDVSEGFIEEAKSKSAVDNVSFEALDFMDAEERFRSERFDYIVGNGILHHLYYDLPASLLQIRSLLNEGGRIAFLEPNLHNPYVYLIFSQSRLRRVARLEPDEMAFSRRFALERLASAGFVDVEVEYRDFLIPGVPDWAIRPIVRAGALAERTPGARHLAQSLFICGATSPASPTV
jgi:SAM-dependent methyltransferase